MFVTLVVSHVVESESDRFEELALRHSGNCIANEPGCQDFQVVRDADRPNSFAFVESYSDAAAFKAHLESEHLQWWKDVTAGLFEGDSVVVRGELLTGTTT